MKSTLLIRRAIVSWQLVAVLTLAGRAAFAAPLFDSKNSVSDILGVAHETDSLLVNPWGIVTGPEGNVHVADNGTGYATMYAPNGLLIGGTNDVHSITIPQASVTSGTLGMPTGVVANEEGIFNKNSNGFLITSDTVSGPAHYLYATEDGAIVGVRESVDEASGVIGVDESASGAGYTGLTLSYVTGTDGKLEHQLYAANFAQGTIDVFDKTFSKLTLSSTSNFTDPTPPALPLNAAAGAFWSPFNVKNVDFVGRNLRGEITTLRRIVVMYAVNTGTSAPLTDVPGVGNGYVSTFTPEGAFLRHLIPAGGLLNSPWGLAVAHAPVAGSRFAVILVGNHGDGQINAYAFTPDIAVTDGQHIGTLVKDVQGNPLAFDGLWDLHFGPKPFHPLEFLLNPCILDEDRTTLFFSAGQLGETHGLVGHILIP